MISVTSFCLCIGLCAGFAAAQASTQPSAEVVLYHQPLGGGRELVVTKGPLVPVSVVGNLLPPSIADRTISRPIGFFSMNLELRFTTGASLRLWSRHYPVHARPPEYASEYEDYQVLAVAVAPNRIFLATTTAGSQIYVHDCALYGATRSVGVNTMAWSDLAAALPLKPGRLSARFRYDEAQDRVEVEVTDFLEDTKLRTLFRQTGPEWTFERVEQWQEKVIQPAD